MDSKSTRQFCRRILAHQISPAYFFQVSIGILDVFMLFVVRFFGILTQLNFFREIRGMMNPATLLPWDLEGS